MSVKKAQKKNDQSVRLSDDIINDLATCIARGIIEGHITIDEEGFQTWQESQKNISDSA